MNELVNLDQIVSEIKFFENQAVVSYWEIGKRLSQAKEQLNHGEWQAWIDTNLGYSYDTANNLIKVFKQYPNIDTYQHLNFSKVLALTSIKDEEERQDFIDSHEVEDMTTRQLQAEIKEYKEALKDKDEKLKFADFNLRELKNAAIESDEENEKLRAELEYAKNYKPEPEIIEKEVVPEDYEDLKASISNLYREREELKNQLLIEKDKKREALKRLEAEEQNREIIREIKGFAWTINAFIKDVGGLLYLVDFLEQVPDTSQKLFISSAETLKQWSEQLDFNIKNRKGLKND